MHKTKLLRLLGISLIVGILGLTGFCKKSKDNNDLALAGLVVAQQQAEQAAQAAYEEANKKENPEFFCAMVMKSGNTYFAKLMPLAERDCNINNLFPPIDEYKQRLLNTIDSDENLKTKCPNTKNAISNFSFPSGGGGSVDFEIRFFYVNGKRSLLPEVNLSTTDFTVVSPDTYKLIFLLSIIYNNFASGASPETSCQTAIKNKIGSLPDSNKFCSIPALTSLSIPACDINSGKTKVVEAQCAYGSNIPSGSIKCKIFSKQF
jgi:hypothetical protein